MATLISFGKHRIFFVLLFGEIFMCQQARASEPDDPAPWRPRVIPSAVRTNAETIRGMAQKFSYTDADRDALLAVSLSLPPVEATGILKDYCARHKVKEGKPDIVWAHAVFCLGLVHTKDARDTLIRFWSEWDRQLEKKEVTFTVKDLVDELNPLGVIADALRFYLDDDTVRKWVYEVNAPKLITDLRKARTSSDGTINVNQIFRRVPREYLIRSLYSWLIIDSVDGHQTVRPETITVDYFLGIPTVTNLSRSASNVVTLAKELPVIRPEVTEGQWYEMRQSTRDTVLDDVSARLGIPLARIIYQTYLKEKMVDDGAKTDLRLWLICLGGYLETSTRNGVFLPEQQDMECLETALRYFSDMKEGFMRSMGCRMIFAVTGYFPDQMTGEMASLLKNLQPLVSDADRQNIKVMVEGNRRKIADRGMEKETR
jgi:hypothetical protein